MAVRLPYYVRTYRVRVPGDLINAAEMGWVPPMLDQDGLPALIERSFEAGAASPDGEPG